MTGRTLAGAAGLAAGITAVMLLVSWIGIGLVRGGDATGAARGRAAQGAGGPDELVGSDRAPAPPAVERARMAEVRPAPDDDAPDDHAARSPDRAAQGAAAPEANPAGSSRAAPDDRPGDATGDLELLDRLAAVHMRLAVTQAQLQAELGYAADLNGDGALDIFDLIEFHALFGAQDDRADFSGDGALDLRDIVAFQSDLAGAAEQEHGPRLATSIHLRVLAESQAQVASQLTLDTLRLKLGLEVVRPDRE